MPRHSTDEADCEPGFLLRARIGRATQRQYTLHATRFLQWCSPRRPSGARPGPYDSHLVRYLESLYQDGDSIYNARCAVYGLIFIRSWALRDHSVLPLARQALQGWAKLCPETSRDPLPWIFLRLLVLGLRKGSSTDKAAADAALIQFDTYCRPVEIVSLCIANVIAPAEGAPARYRRWALLLAPVELIATTKAGQHDDSILVAEDAPHRAFVGGVLSRRLRLAKEACDRPEQPIFPQLNVATYNSCLQAAAARVGLQCLHVTPHMIRRGGPSTDLFEQVRDLQAIQKRGRWHTQSSVARYEKHARLLRVLGKVRRSVLDAARSAAETMQ